ncbi:MAG TPA: hypothetical protein VMX54_19865 [Vicinamibacteria bacterium]|nr:hypothetical protein [Vicinamibacteria bacterium]
MKTDAGSATARCVHCRGDIDVPDHYAHGDHIKCGACGTNHKVVRGDRLRLVLADLGPVKEALEQNQQMVRRLEAELADARGSFGIGANGLGIAVAYAVYQVALEGAHLAAPLLWSCILVAVVSGLLLEGANWAFLAKRQRITRLTGELEEARREASRLRQRLREAARV